jgi:uncharacterized NAD(P)/FAD-binding protein YdhS
VGTLAVVEHMRAAGRLEVVAGRVGRCEAGPEGLDLEMTLRDGGRLRSRFDAIVRGVGPALGSSDVKSPLLQSLLGEGSAALRRASHWGGSAVPEIAVHAEKLAMSLLGR